MTVTHTGYVFDWLGYATLRLETPDGFVAYFDPGRYGVLTGEWSPEQPPEASQNTDHSTAHPSGAEYDARDGDLVCVTHNHHYDSDGIERVAHPDATVVIYDGVDASGIDRDVRPVSDLQYDVQRIETGDKLALDTGVVRSIPAYNDPDGPNTHADGTPLHPRGFGCGYHLTIDGVSVFWPGDTDVIDAHERVELSPSDATTDLSVFVPPIGRSFTMDRREAAELAARLDPDLVLPIHYNTFAALEADSGAFAADVARNGIPVGLDEDW
ncbi:MBL fold metallo-hydrolase [Halocatena pleomorpha]|uniref:MBL fold metallo-hydrolase n=1 Tax=Halocatena pleomorpha TaxID=1785090 RepID=A0A3P3RC39_9EURY|nr:MBL fold metallo-hydrolase [Halocatena pleomorpha]RRJ31036.1 MBL fold metallo-hydrolase [Halocatena pleomorpha]